MTEGKPSTTCQARFGVQIRSAIAAAIQGYLVSSSIRSEGVRRTAMPIPAMSPTMVYFTSSPIPSVMPR
jgi:hypothetical protein